MNFSQSLTTEQRLVDLSRAMPKAAVRALNRCGAKVNTAVVRALIEQTGLKRKTMRRAVRHHMASIGAMEYVLKSRGGNINLRFFNAKETLAGVAVRVHGRSFVVPGTFKRAGHFPNRVAFDSKGKGRGMRGNVFVRVGKGRLPIEGGRSGVYIPNEMITGKSLAAFDTLVATDLPVQIERAIGDALRGY